MLTRRAPRIHELVPLVRARSQQIPALKPIALAVLHLKLPHPFLQIFATAKESYLEWRKCRVILPFCGLLE